MDGIIIVNKPAGWTSHDVVQKVRKILNEKRIGHTGTLDPLATGILVLCIGKATRIARYLEVQQKEYDAIMKLGATTDTLDADGAILETRTYSPPDRREIVRVLMSFTGHIMQRPPAYSAIKISGVAAHKRARRGETVEIEPRPVVVHRIDLLSYDDPFIGLRIICSKGFYIRTLCADIGAALGPGAHLVNLIRTRSGKFTLVHAVTIDLLQDAVGAGKLDNILISIDNALDVFPLVTVGPGEARRMASGSLISGTFSAGEPSLMRVHDQEGGLIAIARAESGKLRPEVVFS